MVSLHYFFSLFFHGGWLDSYSKRKKKKKKTKESEEERGEKERLKSRRLLGGGEVRGMH